MRKSYVVGAAVAGFAFASATGLAVAQDAFEAEHHEDVKGFVEAPGVEELVVDLSEVPPTVLHTAQVAFGEDATITGASLDRDDVLAIWEITGEGGGTTMEVDVKPDAVLIELEVAVMDLDDVPFSILQVFQEAGYGDPAAAVIEKSIRPTEMGLLETWYEFDLPEGNAVDDVEIRNTGQQILVELAGEASDAGDIGEGGEGGETPPETTTAVAAS